MFFLVLLYLSQNKLVFFNKKETRRMANQALQEQLINSQLVINFRTTMLKTPKDRRSAGWLKTNLTQLEEMWKEFFQEHKKLMRDQSLEEDDYFKKDVFSETNTAYTIYKTEILDAMYPGRNVSSLQADEQYAQISMEMPAYRNPLPPINLPQFSGQQLEWETFKDMFTALVHDVPSIPPILKLQYLLRLLTGDAANRLKNVQITAENYANSWQALQDRYDNKKALLFSHMSHIIACPAMQKRSLDEVRGLLDIVRESKNAMDNLHLQPEQMSELWLIHHVVSKLDHTTRLDWEREADRNDHFPTYIELNNFLERSIRVFEAAGHSVAHNNNKMMKSAPNKPRQTSVYTTAIQATRGSGSRACVVCQGTHNVYSCRKFLSWSQPQRYEICKREKLCLNCLQNNHFVKDCPSDKRCFTCGGKHHTKLHSDSQAPRDSANGDQISFVNNESTPAGEDSSTSAYFTNPSVQEQVSNGKLVLLATARVRLQDEFGNEIKVRALIDPCSERSFVSERVITAISVDTKKIAMAMNVMGGLYSSTVEEASVVLKSTLHEDFKKRFSALVMSELTELLPKSRVGGARWEHLRGLTLADPEFHEPNKVDCVIGADLIPGIIMDGIRKGPVGAPLAQRTVFGWTLTGEIHQISAVQLPSVRAFHVQLQPTLHQIVERFWEIEDIAKKQHLTLEEQYCEDYFCKTTTRTETGRFMVRLPFAKSSTFPGSRDIAVSCFTRTERRIAKTPKLDALYKAFMNEYLQLRHMECVPSEHLSRDSFYLPHHGVFRAGDSNKIRVVFNASQKAINRVALNDVLLPGPKLQKDITSVITRWRFSKYVFATDIVKMYRQILVHPDDVDWQRIVWRSDEKKMIQDFRALTVTYGAAPAPFLALRVLQQLANDGRDTHPEAARILDHQVYVDDLFGGGDNMKEAVSRRNQLVHLLSSAGMELGKWSANEVSLLHGVATGDSEEIAMQLHDVVSTLGLKWSTRADCFLFTVSLTSMPSVITKRNILSDVARLFDPLGWLAPVTITAKIILQDLWIERIDWDVPVQGELAQRWQRFRTSIGEVARLRIPRWFGGGERDSWTLHGFADASKRAYAAAVYIVIPGNSSTLMMAKTRVAPAKQETLPRLELCAATLLVRLTKQLLEVLSQQPEEIHFWSDSRVVLDWLKGHPSRWQTFVANRVSEIVNTFPQAQWHHVRSSNNAVDCAKRGLTPEQLLESRLWWNGPSWLTLPAVDWPVEVPEKKDAAATAEVFHVQQAKLINNQSEEIILKGFERFSSYTKLIRVLAYCGRWLHKLRARKNNRNYVTEYVTTAELVWARAILFRTLQRHHYAAEMQCLQSGRQLHKKSKLARLTFFVDEQGLLRLGGRLHNAPLAYNERHPIILPNENIIVKRIVEDAHKYDVSDKQSYRDRWQLLSHMRDAFWNRWRKEVMYQLHLRNKWLHSQENLEKGDLVIIKDDLSPPARWPIGVIINSSPGADGRVRVVTVRTATSTFVRPVIKLIKLPVDAKANEEYERRKKKQLSHEEFTGLLSNIVDEARGKTPILVSGDFNAWSTERGSRETKPMGEALLDALAPLDVLLLNTISKPTFVGQRGGSIYWEDIICSRHPTRPELFAPPARFPLAESPGKRQPVAARSRACSLSPFLRLHPPIPPHLRRPVKIRLEPQGAPRQRRKRRTPPRSPDIPAKRHFGLAFLPVPEKPPSPSPHHSTASPDGSQHEVTDPVPVAPPPTFQTKRQRRNWERAVAHRKRKETKHRGVSEEWPPVAKTRSASSRSNRQDHPSRGIRRRSETSTQGDKGEQKPLLRQLCDEADCDVWGKPYRVVMSRLRAPRTSPPTTPDLKRQAVSSLFPMIVPRPIDAPPLLEEHLIPEVSVEEVRWAYRRMRVRQPRARMGFLTPPSGQQWRHVSTTSAASLRCVSGRSASRHGNRARSHSLEQSCTLPGSAKIVGFADDIAVTVVAKHLDLVEFYSNETIRLVRTAPTDLGLQTADQKTEILLVTSRKVRETITPRAGDHDITSAPCIRYLGVHIDARLRFDERLRIVSDKANRIAGALLGLMPNIGGPRSSRRRLYASVIDSILLYGAPAWSEAAKTHDYANLSKCLLACDLRAKVRPTSPNRQEEVSKSGWSPREDHAQHRFAQKQPTRALCPRRRLDPPVWSTHLELCDGDAGLYPSSRGCASTSLPARDQRATTRLLRCDVRDSQRTCAGPTSR
ncbi:unnamed protein product [Trichogramma brassicae]|uniref:DUF5641 domain-containing protein n=1 Tax=Trichogramma brassicae TaxID=86971 RepID=A0A6H5IPL9_9HYME|nr:unnamed protein product [Trichogramma brassicae]